MKVCTVDMQTDSGALISVPFASAVPAMSLAKSVRVSGVYEGTKILRGLVRPSWDSGIRYSFSVDQSVEEPKKAKAKK